MSISPCHGEGQKHRRQVTITTTATTTSLRRNNEPSRRRQQHDSWIREDTVKTTKVRLEAATPGVPTQASALCPLTGNGHSLRSPSTTLRGFCIGKHDTSTSACPPHAMRTQRYRTPGETSLPNAQIVWPTKLRLKAPGTDSLHLLTSLADSSFVHISRHSTSTLKLSSYAAATTYSKRTRQSEDPHGHCT